MIPHSWPLKPPLGWVTFARRLRSQKTQGREVLRWGETCFLVLLFSEAKFGVGQGRLTFICLIFIHVYSPTWIDYLWQLLSGEIWHHAWGGITFWGTWKRPIYLEIKTTWQVSSLKIREFVPFLPSFSEQPQAQNNLKKKPGKCFQKKKSKTCCQLEAPGVTSRYFVFKKILGNWVCFWGKGAGRPKAGWKAVNFKGRNLCSSVDGSLPKVSKFPPSQGR